MINPLPLPIDAEIYNKLPLSLKLLLWRTTGSLNGYSEWLGGVRPKVATQANNLWFQDYTGLPELANLAAQRDALVGMDKDPTIITAQVDTWMVIDHSVATWTNDAAENSKREFKLNGDRYRLAKWAAKNLGIRVVPPGKGVIHQVNTEYLVNVFDRDGRPNFGKGTDSHSPMVNCLGVLAWGVGGTEAMQVFADQPIEMALPEVYGVRLTGKLPAGINASDLALYLKKVLRELGVTGSFVEFLGPGVDTLSLPSRATISNVAAEFGSRAAMFGIDQATIDFLALTGRDEGVEELARAYGLWRSPETEEGVVRTKVIDVDLSTIPVGISGPDKPHGWVSLNDSKDHVLKVFQEKDILNRTFPLKHNDQTFHVPNGAVLLASIASCTQTANPVAVLRAALLARNAVEKGLKVKPWVKTAFAAGSPVAQRYLDDLGLTPFLRELGFEISAFGCGACIGQSGGLNGIGKALMEAGLVPTSIVSANRNYAGRQDSDIATSFLGRPDLVILYALVGRMDVNIFEVDLGEGVTYLDIAPGDEEIAKAAGIVDSDMVSHAYGDLFKGNQAWENIDVPEGDTYDWQDGSVTVAKPIIFNDLALVPEPVEAITGAHTLFIAGDGFSTDNISPAGDPKGITATMGYLTSLGVTNPGDILSAGGYRSNDNVLNTTMFSNPQNKNLMVDRQGGWTIQYPQGKEVVVFEAATYYQKLGIPQVVVGGKDYGCGSSRVMAASGPAKLGVRAVIAESIEAIHRANLWQWGIAALTFTKGQSAELLQLDGSETWDIPVELLTKESETLEATLRRADGSSEVVVLSVALESDQEFEFYLHGGAVRMQMRELATAA